MSKRAKSTAGEAPRALAISERGIRTGADFANTMSALMSDIIAGRVAPQVGNAACNAGGKLLKAAEMQMKYGTRGTGPERILNLASGIDSLPAES